MNPMYQFVYFMRTIIIGGVSPNPMTYLYCSIAALGSLFIGLYLFRRNQDKFVFNL
jgi:ABC-type polysaccharide/polyol phosphate export systems, permease component